MNFTDKNTDASVMFLCMELAFFMFVNYLFEQKEDENNKEK